MENQETIQENVIPTYNDLVGNSGKNKSECKTCKNKDLASKSNVQIFTIGGLIIFFTVYGVTSFVKDIISFFTR